MPAVAPSRCPNSNVSAPLFSPGICWLVLSSSVECFFFLELNPKYSCLLSLKTMLRVVTSSNTLKYFVYLRGTVGTVTVVCRSVSSDQ